MIDLSNTKNALFTLTHAKDLKLVEVSHVTKPLLEAVTDPTTSIEVFTDGVLKLFTFHQWEAFACSLSIADYVLKSFPEDQLTSEWRELVLLECKEHVDNREPRVRNLVGVCLEGLSRIDGNRVYMCMKEALLKSISENINRKGHEEEEESDEVNDDVSSVVSSASAKPVIAHETVGWKALETSIKALRSIIKGWGSAFVSEGHLTSYVLDLCVRQSTKHVNRFVREAAYNMLETISDVSTTEMLSIDVAINKMYIKTADGATPADGVTLVHEIVELLAIGLGDNWSQVRYASSIATRVFLLKCDSLERKFHYKLLLPRMCLNRYYVAEGVRLYSQETWKLVLGDEGKDMVAYCIKEIVEFYMSQSNADNHAVREAACHCIAELASKIDANVVQDCVPELLKVLVDCFKDESWPVRDAACIASGRFVLSCPKECENAIDVMAEFYKLWEQHLSDNIWSVREDSAVALGNVARAYGAPAEDKMISIIEKLLPLAVTKQAKESYTFGSLGNVTTFGVAPSIKHAHDNDEALHTGQQVFSCGSLAPKLKRGAGCMDHGFTRPSQPWESSDGAVYLLREMSLICPKKCIPLMKVLAEISDVRHFRHASSLRETIWKQLPHIMRAIGKRECKRNVQEFINPMFDSIQGDHRLSSHAAGGCAADISSFIGPSIFSGRLDDMQLRVFETSPLIHNGGVGAETKLPSSAMFKPTAVTPSLPTISGKAPWAK
jgi:hypothetical protein